MVPHHAFGVVFCFGDVAFAHQDVPAKVSCAFGFFEKLGGLDSVDALRTHPILKESISSMFVCLARTNPVGPSKAPRPSVAQFLACEIAVLDCKVLAFYRIFSWYLLVRVWTSSRCDDSLHWIPSSFLLGDKGLDMKIYQTKTTGPDKSAHILVVVVSKHATLSGLPWLDVGHSLLQSSGFNFPRDFVFCVYLRPTVNRSLRPVHGAKT